MLNFDFYGKTDVGLKRSNNEDTFLINGERGFCLVADGLGGAAAGELASRIFAETAAAVFQPATDLDEKGVIERVQNSFRLAHERILHHAQRNPSHGGMGCTAELMAISDQGFVVGHLGDSRTYRFRQGQLKQLTHDHSLIQDHIDKGVLSPENARGHPLRNVILRAVGISDNLALDLIRGRTYPEDQFLLCSDGLTDLVDDDQIHKVLQSTADHHHQKADQLINMALSGGGNDNITVVLVSVR
jgi:serine/threonine protein phosphatase PrpC